MGTEQGLKSSTLSHLLAAVLASPEDDMPRLAYADALDEEAGGYDPSAAFIRKQIMNPSPCMVPLMVLVQLEPVLGGLMAHQFVRNGGPSTESTVTYPNVEFIYRRGFVEIVAAPLVTLIGGECERCGGLGRLRAAGVGSAHSPPCPACSGTGRTVGILPAVLKEHPVTSVRVTDKEPQQQESECVWYSPGAFLSPRQDREVLPVEIFDLLPDPSRVVGGWKTYPTRELADAALSAAVLKYAKGVGA